MKWKTLSLKTIINELNFFKIQLLLISNKLIKVMPDPRNTKEHYKSFVKEENRKSVKKSEIITYQQK